ncbi:MAG: flagellar basal-body rod protein FlgB [Gammaproteobacteria bacterium]|jgi:flagellar basal-body rod protein FlgB
MPSLDQALGIHPQAMMLRAQRAELLAANLANADTPNYQARDIDFRAVLAGSTSNGELTATHAKHLGNTDSSMLGAEIMYRAPTQPSIDQNTVDVAAERARFLDNSLRYQASLRFLDGRFAGIKSALRGE